VGEFRLRFCIALGLVLGVAGAALAQDSYGPVGNETLWAVATKVNAGRSTTTAQMAWALYRANPQAFDGSPNKIRTNAVLKVPGPAFVAEIPAAQAYAYVTGARAPPVAQAVAAAPAPPPRPVAVPPVTLAATPAQSSITTTALGSTAFAGSAEQSTAAGMVSANQSADAVYRYLAPFEDRYAGDVDFDYLLGTAAYDSGRYSQAIFVLQRAVAMRPGFAGARMELARAYYAQGDNESARREFAILEKDNPPPEARRVIAEYLDAIDRRASVYEQQLAGYAELATGYDSNANGAPDIQDFIGFQLDSRNQATASSYYNLGAGGLVSYPFAPGWRLLGTGNAGYRSNPDATFVDSQVLRLGGAVEWRPGNYELSLQPNFAMAMLDGEDNSQMVGVDLAGTRHFEQSRVSLTLRSGQIRYADGLEVLDVDTLAYGVAAQYTTRAMPRVQYVGAITLGSDDAVQAGSPQGRDLTGLRAGAVVDFGGGHALLLAVSTLTADYDGVFFGADRSDDQFGGTLGYEWGGWRALGWTVRGQLNYVDNSSSVALYDYDRIDAGLSVRREFR
jgi:FimV-like protein